MKTTVSAALVLRACDIAIARRAERIALDREELIAEAMQEDQRTWLERMLRKPVQLLDREATIERLRKEGYDYFDRMHNRWNRIVLCGQTVAERVCRMRALANYSCEGAITVDGNDALLLEQLLEQAKEGAQ